MTVDSVVSSPPVDPTTGFPPMVVAPPVPKPGIKTSEAWISGFAAIVGALMASGLWPDDSIYMKIAGILAAALAAFGYSVSRGIVKAAFHGAAKVILVGLIAAHVSACACSSVAHRNDFVCAVERQVVDCTEASIVSETSQFLPIVLGLIGALTSPDGTVDLTALEAAFVNLGIKDGGCLLAAAQSKLFAVGAKAESSPRTAKQAASFQGSFDQIRRARWAGVRFKLADGSVL